MSQNTPGNQIRRVSQGFWWRWNQKEERKLKLRLKRLTATGRKDDLPWNRNSVVWQIVRIVVRLASLDSRMGS